MATTDPLTTSPHPPPTPVEPPTPIPIPPSHSQPAPLDPSPLGTKQYWDHAYALEAAQHAASPTSDGTIWFASANAERNVLAYLARLASARKLFRAPDPRKPPDGAAAASTILDLGTGNGHMLFALRGAGWRGPMVGLDYSGASIALCNRLRHRRRGPDGAPPVRFVECDVFADAVGPRDWIPAAGGFDVVLDKGTFDAVSLCADTGADGRRVGESYAARVEPFVADGGLFIVTSCNWTEDEVRAWFERRPGARLAYYGSVEYPTFTFGGRSGSKVCTVCFEKLK